MGYVLERLRPGGELPDEEPPSRASLPGDLAADAARALPVLLKPAQKRVLDLLAGWPWLLQKDLAACWAFLRLAFLASSRRWRGSSWWRAPQSPGADWPSPIRGWHSWPEGTAPRWAWPAAGGASTPLMPPIHRTGATSSGGRSRQLLRNLDHTAAVHGFLASLARQARARGWDVAQLDPPHRASRHFRHGGALRAVNPDAFGVLRRGPATWAFFLEWERRAVRPVTMAARLAPYLRYYASHRPTDDHGTRPAVLVVFDDDIAATHFLMLAEREMAQAKVKVPLWVSHREAIDSLGPLGRAWLRPGSWQPARLPPAQPTPIRQQERGAIRRTSFPSR